MTGRNVLWRKSSDRTKETILLKRNSSSILYESFRDYSDRTIDELYRGVKDGDILSSQITGIVRLCTHKITGDEYAITTIDLQKISERNLLQLKSEVGWMSEIDHPDILRLEEVYQSPTEIFLVQEIYKEGISFENLKSEGRVHFSESQVMTIVQKMIGSLDNLHSRGMKHFNISLRSFLFSSEDKTDIKLIDFGHERYFSEDEIKDLKTEISYARDPEMLLKICDERCDLWSVGVIVYILFTGEAPFGGYNDKPFVLSTKNKNRTNKYQYGVRKFTELSKLAKAFISKLLQRDPEDRFQTLAEALGHPWFTSVSSSNKKGNDEETLSQNESVHKDYSEIEKFCCKLLSSKLTSDQVHDLRIYFQHLFVDVDSDGFIDLDDLKSAFMAKKECAALGAVTDSEIYAIFNELNVQTTGGQINWLTFIDTLMQMCESDDGSIRESFCRIRKNEKESIALYDLIHFQDNLTDEQKGDLRNMFEEGIKIRNERNKISRGERFLQYEDFLLLMKGQTTHSSYTSWNGIYYLRMRSLLLDRNATSIKSNRDKSVEKRVFLESSTQLKNGQQTDLESYTHLFNPAKRRCAVHRSFSDTDTKEFRAYPSKFELRTFSKNIQKKNENIIRLHGIAA